MPKRKSLPTKTVLNPIALMLFRKGWEDPSWGREPVDQATIATAIYDLASKLDDGSAKASIQEAAATALSGAAQKLRARKHGT